MFGIPYNTLIVLAGTGLLGMVCGLIGSFAVLRGRALLGDALAHAALPGICVAFLLLQQRDFTFLLAGAMASGVMGVWIITSIRKHTRTKEDAAIGIVLSVFFGAGVVLSRIIQNTSTAGSKAGLDGYIFGKTAAMVAGDVTMILAVGAAVLAAVLLLFKEFKLLSFDPGFAAAAGSPTFLLDIAMMTLLTVTTMLAIPAVGVVMVAAMLIIPGAAARFWTRHLGRMLLLAAAFGAATGLLGTAASSQLPRFPAGPVIVLVGAALFLVSMAFAPHRGMVAMGIEQLRLRARVARQNLLRTMYELGETALPDRPPVTVGQLTARRAWSHALAATLLRAAIRRGAVRRQGDGYVLTDAGFSEAAEVVRAHRLWELFLVEYARIAPDHVHRDAEQIEHVLPREMIAELEEKLLAAGRLPAAGAVPKHLSDHMPEDER